MPVPSAKTGKTSEKPMNLRLQNQANRRMREKFTPDA
jgi:hypothetical protein